MNPATFGRSTSFRNSCWYPRTTQLLPSFPSVICFDRYWIPELFVALQRNDSRNSKFFVLPSFQMMNVLPLATFSAVVSPCSTPSLTLHNRGSPSHPVRSLPLNSTVMPAVSGGAVAGESAAVLRTKQRQTTRAV